MLVVREIKARDGDGCAVCQGCKQEIHGLASVRATSDEFERDPGLQARTGESASKDQRVWWACLTGWAKMGIRGW